MDNVIVLAGPTASGKTKTSIELAKRLGGEIISADSMQIYKYMDIGTAKPDEAERSGIKHYLIDEVTPHEEFSVARYQKLALEYIKEILDKGKVPIIAGGTGLYINSLIYNINFSETICDWDLRKELKKKAEENGSKYIHDMLRKIDPQSAERIHENDVKRIIRAIEVYHHTGMPISYHQEISRELPPLYNFIIIGLWVDRKILYKRIDDRVDNMMKAGLVDEVKRLKDMGYDETSVAMQGLGYKEILSYLNGAVSLDDAVYTIKRDTRHYAKRQYTWFRRLDGVQWIVVLENDTLNDIIQKVETLLQVLGYTSKM